MTTKERLPTSEKCVKLILTRSVELLEAYEGLMQADSAHTRIFVRNGALLRNQRAKEHNIKVNEQK